MFKTLFSIENFNLERALHKMIDISHLSIRFVTSVYQRKLLTSVKSKMGDALPFVGRPSHEEVYNYGQDNTHNAPKASHNHKR